MTYYERKMAECMANYQDALDASDADAQAKWLKEYENYERMAK